MRCHHRLVSLVVRRSVSLVLLRSVWLVDLRSEPLALIVLRRFSLALVLLRNGNVNRAVSLLASLFFLPSLNRLSLLVSDWPTDGNVRVRAHARCGLSTPSCSHSALPARAEPRPSDLRLTVRANSRRARAFASYAGCGSVAFASALPAPRTNARRSSCHAEPPSSCTILTAPTRRRSTRRALSRPHSRRHPRSSAPASHPLVCPTALPPPPSRPPHRAPDPAESLPAASTFARVRWLVLDPPRILHTHSAPPRLLVLPRTRWRSSSVCAAQRRERRPGRGRKRVDLPAAWREEGSVASCGWHLSVRAVDVLRKLIKAVKENEKGLERSAVIFRLSRDSDAAPPTVKPTDRSHLLPPRARLCRPHLLQPGGAAHAAVCLVFPQIICR
ncbi:hypothetical protein C8J57DRAFT_1528461 [Mycena rebaudengoi]|nr:hypothetical protein C8J57DRAFT_1528461 [Mycena rebaudengoi]